MRMQRWPKILPIFFMLWIGMVGLTHGSDWSPLYQEGEKTIYLDKETFQSNLEEKVEGTAYRVLVWLRYETLEEETFLEQQYEVQMDRKSGAIRFRMTQARYTGADGTVASAGHGSWERLKKETPEEKMIQRVWRYDLERSKTPDKS